MGPPLPGKKQKKLGVTGWPGATGLAEDVRRYGAWMREQAFERIGHLYPKVKITEEMAEAGVLHSGGGKVRLLKREELPSDYDPADDERLTVWKATQHLIERLDEAGEAAAARLLSRLDAVSPGIADKARDLAYRLYTVCERRGWAEEARAYNGLVVAWPELEKLAGSADTTTNENDASAQAGLFD